MKASGIKQIFAYDQAESDPEYSEIIHKRALDANVQLVQSLEELMVQSELIFSSVWGNLALKVAKEAAQFIKPDRMYADLINSTPTSKYKGAEAITAKGADFIDIAIFGPPSKQKHKVLMCVSGDGAEQFKLVMSKYGMKIKLMPGEAGKATTIKTLAKIYYLGAQALYLELATSARKAGCDIEYLLPILVNPTVNMPREDEMAFRLQYWTPAPSPDRRPWPPGHRTCSRR
ncbi:hypothetical protein DSCW_00770 [Desulfosarcina widdelii]|uniref:6-phosphogluconate dehydrogenase NADP-binding domain-containing protein n=1 Tax=Desulfosarcina widdelii TaxID=947919 RepID=A0A5K7YWF4_9BACT|nr:hypothetical protein DSCW_00770 [Desulfosarcina widdelii]